MHRIRKSEEAQMQLADRVALVTGGGSGIGRAAAVLMAKEGARAGVLSRDREELQQVVEEIEHNGGEAMLIVADVSHPDDMQRAVKEVVARWGRLDIVFAN